VDEAVAGQDAAAVHVQAVALQHQAGGAPGLPRERGNKCVCVCVCERERDRDREAERERETEGEKIQTWKMTVKTVKKPQSISISIQSHAFHICSFINTTSTTQRNVTRRSITQVIKT
jgi:hypothetical protein